MTTEEYEQKKRECWDALHKELLDGEVQWQPVSRKEIVNFAFDRAYALGKQEKDADSFEIGDKVRVKETNQIGTIMEPYSNDVGYRVYFDDGDGGEDAEFTADQLELYKKTIESKDAEGTVIQGWVAIDEAFNQCFLHTEKPIQKAQPIADTGDYDTVWDSKGKTYLLDTGLFPDMDSDSDPIEVEIIIKRKNLKQE